MPEFESDTGGRAAKQEPDTHANLGLSNVAAAVGPNDGHTD